MRQEEISLRTRSAFWELLQHELAQTYYWQYVDAYKAQASAYNQWQSLDSATIAVLIDGSSDSENLLNYLKVREDQAALLIHFARAALISMGAQLQDRPNFQNPLNSSLPESPDTPRTP